MTRLPSALLLLAAATVASAQRFTTSRFDVDLAVSKDARLRVEETIAISFTERQRGLNRKVPFRTRGGGFVREVSMSFVEAEIDRGRGWQPVQTRVTREGGDWQVRLGSPNVWLEGPVRYRLVYLVDGALTPIQDRDRLGPRTELIWNVLPTAWATSIPAATVRIRWPEPEAGPLSARILAGDLGTRTGLQLNYGGADEGRSDRVRAAFESKKGLRIDLSRPLARGQGMTVAVALPGNTVVAPPPRRQAERPDRSETFLQPRRWGSPWWGLAPLIGAGLIFLMARRRWPQPEKPLVVKFDPPPGIGPSLSGTIIDHQVNPRDVVAGIVVLAQKGALKLHHVGGSGSVHIELRNRPVQGLDYFEQQLLWLLQPFGPIITPESLRGSFGTHYNTLAAALEQEAVDRGYFASHGWLKAVLTMLLVAITAALACGFCILHPVATVAGSVASLVLGGIFIARISDYTPVGQDMRRELQGLREFITRANREELNYMADREPDQALFERLLPYAIAFDAVRQWTEAFKGIEIQTPDWYTSDVTDAYWMWLMMDDFTHLSHDYGTAMSYHQPTTSFGTGDFFSSGDSGFGGSWSDGGFDGGFSIGDGGGGGGGDSW